MEKNTIIDVINVKLEIVVETATYKWESQRGWLKKAPTWLKKAPTWLKKAPTFISYSHPRDGSMFDP